jgi:protein-S-isoprenylcysteine O-methyltransferase Ste14
VAEKRRNQYWIAGIKSLAISYIIYSVQVLVFYFAAGEIVQVRSWIYFGTTFIHVTVNALLQWILNPELLIQRLKIRREGSKGWDEVLMRVCNLTIILVVPLVAGFDIGRFHWLTLDVNLIPIGLILVASSTALLNWAMVANPFFEATVRIQKDRAHKVVIGGPYKIVRHPGYLSGILFALAIPLIIGSAITFIPTGIYIFLMMIRTELEDETLQKELKGYTEYTRKTKYRLLPWIW